MSLNTPRNKPSRTETEAVAATSERSAVGRRDCTEQLRRAARRNAWDLYGEHFYWSGRAGLPLVRAMEHIV